MIQFGEVRCAETKSLDEISVACRVNHIDKWIDWTELNGAEWMNEQTKWITLLMTMAIWQCISHSKAWHSFNNCLNSGWMRKMCEMHLTDLIDFSFFFHCEWNALVFIHRSKMEWEYEKRVRYFRCSQYESGVNWKCINEWLKTNENERKKNAATTNKKNKWKKNASLCECLWLMHFYCYEYIIVSGMHIGCVHCMVISLLEMFQIVLINCTFAHLNGWILQ